MQWELDECSLSREESDDPSSQRSLSSEKSRKSKKSWSMDNPYQSKDKKIKTENNSKYDPLQRISLHPINNFMHVFMKISLIREMIFSYMDISSLIKLSTTCKGINSKMNYYIPMRVLKEVLKKFFNKNYPNLLINHKDPYTEDYNLKKLLLKHDIVPNKLICKSLIKKMGSSFQDIIRITPVNLLRLFDEMGVKHHGLERGYHEEFDLIGAILSSPPGNIADLLKLFNYIDYSIPNSKGNNVLHRLLRNQVKDKSIYLFLIDNYMHEGRSRLETFNNQQETPLFSLFNPYVHSLDNRDKFIFESLLILDQMNFDFHIKDNNDRNLWYYLSKEKYINKEIVDFVVSKGIPFNDPDTKKSSIFSWFSRESSYSLDWFRVVVEQDNNLNMLSLDRRENPFSLFLDKFFPSIEILDYLMDKGANFSIKTADDRILLHAFQNLNKENSLSTKYLKHLLTKKIPEWGTVNEEGYKPLELIIKSDKLPEKFFEWFALDRERMQFSGKYNRNIVHLMCKYSSKIYIKNIWAFHQTPELFNVKDLKGNTPIHYMLRRPCREEVIIVLLAMRADISIVNNHGKAFSHLLIKKHSDLNISKGILQNLEFIQQDLKGRTAFHYFCRNKNLHACDIRRFFKNVNQVRFDINKQDNDGYSALHHLAFSSNLHVDSLLLFIKNNARIDLLSKKGENILHIYFMTSAIVKTREMLEICKQLGQNTNDGSNYIHYYAKNRFVSTPEFNVFFHLFKEGLLKGDGNPFCAKNQQGETPFHVFMKENTGNSSSVSILQFFKDNFPEFIEEKIVKISSSNLIHILDAYSNNHNLSNNKYFK